ncbi:basement membrane-specific heparan sulfate proteoglycan core protein-like isoform X5 [Dysidea avara]|uniref:basement membrane-specific heparan sulfate proteoglycan core protein-like isoform X5 n=1 Tax=Dysidea avara TaxID=196820 RepID=UPI0033223172
MSALKIYYEFNPKLVNSLPVKDPIFCAKLLQKGMFSGNVKAKMKAQPTDADAAEYFLDHVIQPPLDSGDTGPFEKLLTVMEQFNSQPLKKLASVIRQKLEDTSEGDGASATGGELTITAPTFTTPPSPQSVDLTQTAIFTCSATGDDVKYQWTIGSGSFPSKVTGINTNTLVIPDVRSSDDNTYSCTISNDGGSVTSDPVQLTVTVTAPTFTTPPSPQSVDLTQTATFTCSAIGDDVKYQWTIGSGSFPSKVTGIDTNTLVIPDVRSSDDNTYSCTISNDGGSVTSDTVQLTVTGLPKLNVLPSSQSVNTTQSSKFTTTASGIGVENFTYQWQHNGEEMNGETGDTLNLNHITGKEGGLYQCIVKNQYGDSDVSSAELVVTITAPTFTTPPSPQSVDLTQTATFTCSATGDDVKYQWTIGSGSFPSKVTGINTNTLVIPDVRSSDDNTYSCTISNDGGSVTSDPVQLTVTVTAPTFTTPPSPQSVDLTQTATFTCSATGDDVKYQWTIGSGSCPSKVTGINTNTLVIPDVRSSDDNTYSCTISNDGGSVTSDHVQLTVTGLPKLSVLPSSQSVSTTQSITFTTTVSGIGVENFTYQWQHNGEVMNGETGDTLNLNHITGKEGGLYQCIVKNQYGDSDVSSAELVVTITAPTFTTPPSPQSVDLTQTATFKCSATGDDMKYQWTIGSGSFPSKVTGINTNTLVIPDVRSSDDNTYSCTISNDGGSVTSDHVQLTVTGLPKLSVLPSSQSVSTTQSTKFTTIVSGIGVENFTYRWQHNGEEMNGETGDTLNLNHITGKEGGLYQCIVKNQYGDSDVSSAELVITITAPTFTTPPSPQSVDLTQTATFTCSATGDDVKYQWSIGSGSFPSKVTGINTNTLVIPDVRSSDDNTYSCTISNDGGSVTSDPVQLTVTVTAPIFTTPPSPQSVDLTQTATFTCSATGDDVKYQWTIGSGSFPSKVTGINTNTLVIPDVRSSDDNTYSCTISNDGGSVTSDTVQLTVTGLPKLKVQPSSQSVGTMQSAKFTTTVSGVGVENFTYQWQHNGEEMNGETGDALNLNNITGKEGGSYQCIVKNQYGDSDMSSAELVVTITAPTFTTPPSPQSVDLTQTATFTCSATGDDVKYQWTIGSGSFPSKVTGINTNTLVIPDVRSSDDNTYSCTISNDGGSVTSDPVQLTVTVTAPTFTAPPSPQSVDLTQTATFTCSATGDDVKYHWTIGSGSFPSKVTGINTNTLVIPDVRSSDDNTYSCTISNDGGSVTSNPVQLAVTGLPKLKVLPSSQSVKTMQSAKFTTTVSGIGVENFTYRWQHNGVEMNGETGDTLNLTNITGKEGGSYQCIVKNRYGDNDASSAELVITTTEEPTMPTPPEGRSNDRKRGSIRSRGTGQRRRRRKCSVM